jgi:hypothetical protein
MKALFVDIIVNNNRNERLNHYIPVNNDKRQKEE